jgi:hypothetical protein
MLVGTAGGVLAVPVPVQVMVGDDDGYGLGVADGGMAVWPGAGPFGSMYDGRDAAESAASDGAQLTDVYSSILPGYGPNLVSGSVVMPFAGALIDGVLTVDMGDFQTSDTGAPIGVDFNGIPQLWDFDDGFRSTVVRSFALGEAVIAAANADGQLVVNLDRSGSSDFLAFDFFRLDGHAEPGGTPEFRTEPVSDPGATLGLFALALSALGGALRPLRSRA